MPSFTATKTDAGKRLIDFLRERLDCSARRAKALLDQRVVLVNQRRIWMAKHPLKPGDTVLVLQEPSPTATPNINLLLEHPELLVVNKPAGLKSNGPHSVENLLRKTHPEARAAHRLDTDTSGCLIIARSPECFEALKNLFRNRQVKKRYLAIVAGRFNRPTQTLRQRLDRQEAITHIRRLHATHNTSLLELHIETGRTHQIRRHLASINFPILGEKQYLPGTRLPTELAAIPRQLLHAHHLHFPHPMQPNTTLTAKAPLPNDFTHWLSQLALRPPNDHA